MEFVVLGYEALGALVVGVGGEGGQQHDALGQGGVKAGHCQDAVHAVHAEEGGGVAHALGLVQDDGVGLVVGGQEDQIRALALGVGQLHGEVALGVLGEGALADDLQAHLAGLGHEGVPDALGVSVVVAVDDAHLRPGHVLGDIVGGANALVGVGEADLEHVVLAADDVGGGGGGGQGKYPVVVDLSGHGDGGAGGDGAHQDLHAPVHQGVVGVDGGLAVGHVVLGLELKLDAAQGVDLVHGDLGAVHGGVAVDGGVAGQGAHAAQLKGAAGAAGGGVGGGLAAVSGRGAAVGGLVIAAAAGGQAQYHGQSQQDTKKLLHHTFSFCVVSLTFIYKKAAPPQERCRIAVHLMERDLPLGRIWGKNQQDRQQNQNSQYQRIHQAAQNYQGNYNKNGRQNHGVQNHNDSAESGARAGAMRMRSRGVHGAGGRPMRHHIHAVHTHSGHCPAPFRKLLFHFLILYRSAGRKSMGVFVRTFS